VLVDHRAHRIHRAAPAVLGGTRAAQVPQRVGELAALLVELGERLLASDERGVVSVTLGGAHRVGEQLQCPPVPAGGQVHAGGEGEGCPHRGGSGRRPPWPGQYRFGDPGSELGRVPVQQREDELEHQPAVALATVAVGLAELIEQLQPGPGLRLGRTGRPVPAVLPGPGRAGGGAQQQHVVWIGAGTVPAEAVRGVQCSDRPAGTSAGGKGFRSRDQRGRPHHGRQGA
jgi:hypothetical protein